MKEVVTFQVAIKVGGTWRTSPQYATPEEAVAQILPFVKKLKQKYTTCTIQRCVRYVADESAAQ